MDKPNRENIDAFTGCLAELQTWFLLGTEAQREKLVIAIRDMSDLIDEEMPTIDTE